MRIARFTTATDAPHLALVADDELLDVSGIGHDDAVALLALDAAERAALEHRARRKVPRISRASARLLAPIARPPEFLAVGFNYRAHVAELTLDSSRPDVPRLAAVGEATRAGFPSSRTLEPGDVIEVDGLGALDNPVVAEPVGPAATAGLTDADRSAA